MQTLSFQLKAIVFVAFVALIVFIVSEGIFRAFICLYKF